MKREYRGDEHIYRLILCPICGHEETEQEFGLTVEHGTRAILSQWAVAKHSRDVAAKFSKLERPANLSSV